MRYLKFIHILFLFLLFCQCSSFEPPRGRSIGSLSCGGLDWFELGRKDGVRGKVFESWKSHAKGCSGDPAEIKNSYKNGWVTGVDSFCSESHIFTIGKSGQVYNDVCSSLSKKNFLPAHQAGLKVYSIEKENSKIIAKIRNLENRLSQMGTTDKLKAISSIRNLRLEKAENDRSIVKIESSVLGEGFSLQ